MTTSPTPAPQPPSSPTPPPNPPTPQTPTKNEPVDKEEVDRLLNEHNQTLQDELEQYKRAYAQEFAKDLNNGLDLARKAQDELRSSAMKAAKALIHLAEHADKEEIRFKAATFIYDRSVVKLLEGEEEGLEKLLAELRGS